MRSRLVDALLSAGLVVVFSVIGFGCFLFAERLLLQ